MQRAGVVRRECGRAFVDFEREADFLGIEFAEKAGYDPAAMLGLLRKIYDEQKVNPTVVPPYFLSHPLSGERMAVGTGCQLCSA